MTLCVVWSGSALLSLPTLLYSRTQSYRYGDHSVRTVCMLVWPDGRLHGSFADYVECRLAVSSNTGGNLADYCKDAPLQ
ncbi:hypothetical protein MRX96_054979 [Rhipicephalus microplus]